MNGSENNKDKWINLHSRYFNVFGKNLNTKMAFCRHLEDYVSAVLEDLKRLGIISSLSGLPYEETHDFQKIQTAKEKITELKANIKLKNYIFVKPCRHYWYEAIKERNDLTYYQNEVLEDFFHFKYSNDFMQEELPTTTGKRGTLERQEIKVIGNKEAQAKYPMRELVELCKQICFETIEGLVDENYGSIEQWVEINEDFQEYSKMLTVNGEIVGFLYFICVNDELFEKCKDGTILEKDITPEKCAEIHVEGNFKAYFSYLTIKKKYRDIDNYRMLENSFFEQLEQFAENGIFITEWSANAFTTPGRRLCEAFGMKYLCDNKEGGKMYYLTEWWKSNHTLIKSRTRLVYLYKNRFDK